VQDAVCYFRLQRRRWKTSGGFDVAQKRSTFRARRAGTPRSITLAKYHGGSDQGLAEKTKSVAFAARFPARREFGVRAKTSGGLGRPAKEGRQKKSQR
jgi:hypothetical protein